MISPSLVPFANGPPWKHSVAKAAKLWFKLHCISSQ